MNHYVSLLPVEYRQRMADEAKQKKILFGSFIASGVLVIALVFSFGIKLFLEADVADMEKNIEQVSVQIAGFGNLETLQQEMQTLQGKVNSVQKLDAQWLPAIYEVGNSIPKGVWMESIVCSSNGTTGRTMVLECKANDYTDIAKTIQFLEETDLVVSAHCTSSGVAATTEEFGALKFTLSVVLQDAVPVS